MNRSRPAAIAVLWLAAAPAIAPGQEKSVRPGVNDPFRDPNVQEWVTRFEGESRETFEKRKEIVAACRIEPGATVADVGAGTGLFTRLLSAEVGEKGKVYANDITPRFLEYIAERARELRLENVRTVLGKDSETSLPEAACDVVFLCDTYHHFEYPQRMLASIRRALKPEGRLIVIDFIKKEGVSTPRTLEHVRADQEAVEREIGDAGFQKTGQVDGLLRENYMIVFRKMAEAPTARP